MRVLQRILIYLAFYTFGSYGGHPHDGNEKSADNPPVDIFDYIPPSLQQNSTYVRRLHHGSGHGNRPPRPVPPPVRPPANPPDGEQTRMFIKLSSVGDVRPAEASIKNVVLQINNGPNLLSDQESSMKGVPFNRGKSPDWEIFTGKTSFMSSWGTLRPWGRTSQVADLYGDGEGLSKEILVPISANEIEHVKLSVDLRFGRAYDNPNRKYVMETGYIVNDSYVSLASVSAAPTINDPGPRWWQTYQASRDNTPPPLEWLGWDPQTRINLKRCQGDCDGDHQCPKGNLCGGSTYPGTRIPGCRNLIVSGQGGNYCYDPHYLSDYGLDAYDTHKPLLLCEGNCKDDSECGRGLVCSRSLMINFPYGCFRGQSINPNHGYCIYPWKPPSPISELESIDMCTRCDDDHPCPDTLSCIAANPIENFDRNINAFDFVPGCTTTQIDWGPAWPQLSYTPGDKYCTIPMIKDVVLNPGRQLQHCESSCTGNDQCEGAMVCHKSDGVVDVPTCQRPVKDEFRNNSVKTSSRQAGLSYCIFPPLVAKAFVPGLVNSRCDFITRVPTGQNMNCGPNSVVQHDRGFAQNIRMCGPGGTAGATSCAAKKKPPQGRCPRKHITGTETDTETDNPDHQRISREQRFSGEPHCCVNFPGLKNQPLYPNPENPGGGGPCQKGTCNNSSLDQYGVVYIVRVKGDLKKRAKIGCGGNNSKKGYDRVQNCFKRFKEEFYVGVEVEFICITVTKEMATYFRYKYENDKPTSNPRRWDNCNAAEKKLQDWFYCQQKWLGRANPILHDGVQTGTGKGRTEWFKINLADAKEQLVSKLYYDWKDTASAGTVTIQEGLVNNAAWTGSHTDIPSLLE